MIEFLTLFLGLVTGPKDVAVAVADAVVAVEIVLDGESVARLEGEPWRVPVDFGEDLVPRELAAVAFDGEGEEVGRVVQRLNVPRAPAEVSILLERNDDGEVTAARLGWESSVPGGLLAMTVRLDGRELVVDSRERIELPSLDEDDLHLLEVELDFEQSVTAYQQVAFGGHLGHAGRDLTAIPVERVGDRDPMAADLAGKLTLEGEPLRIVAVEPGPAEVVIVRTASAATALQRLAGGPGITASGRSQGMRAARMRKAFGSATLAPEQRFRLLYPAPQRAVGHEMIHEVFPVTPPVSAEEGGIYWHAAPELELEEDKDPRLADAVAVAGNRAAAGGRRRAVVLVLGPARGEQGSLYTEAQVRRYLASLRVPFRVWYLGRSKHAPENWGDPVVISSFSALEEEVENLSRLLDRQRIVWVDGNHLVRRVELSGEGTGVRLLD